MPSRTTKAALVAAGTTIAISVFIAVVGLPYSAETVTEQCSIGSGCVGSSTYTSALAPAPIALIPLLAGVLVALGLTRGPLGIAWAGTIFLLAFSFVGLASIGLFYMPLGIALVGLLAALSSRARIIA